MATAFDLGEVILGTVVDLTGLGDGLDDAKKQSEQQGQGIGQALTGAIKLGVLAGAAAVTAAVVGIGAAAIDVAGQTDQASRTIQAQLGTTAEEAERLGDVALQVFGDNWYGSVEEAGAVVGTLRQQLGDLADDELRTLAGGAAALSDTFGVETTESISAAKTLMDNFGLTSEQAFDFITKGFQSGLDRSGDFLDTIGEYSVQFKDGGADAGQFFSLMESGLQGGMLGTDKAADAFKEFRIRIMELGDDVWGPDGALTSIMETEDIDRLFNGLQDGSITAVDAMNEILPVLQGMDNTVQQNSIGVALFGTQWEDLGPTVAMSLDTTTTHIADLTGATDSLGVKYGSFGDIWGAVTRKATVALEPLGEKLLSIANEAMPVVEAGLAWLGEELPPLIDQAVVAIDAVIATGQAWGANIMQIVGFVEANLTPILAGLGAALLALIPIILSTLVPAFIAWATTAGAAALATVVAMAPVIAVVAAVGVAVGLLVAAWQNDWGGIRTTLTQVWEGTLRPVFDQLKTWLDKTLTQAISTLATYWRTTLQPAIATVAGFVTGTLIPAFQGIVTKFGEVVTKAGAVASAVGESLLGPLRTAADLIKGALVSAVSDAQGKLTAMAGWLNSIKDAASGVVRWIGAAVGAIEDAARAAIPDWLEGKSPPPMANWLNWIAEGAEHATLALGDMGDGIGGLPTPTLEPVAAQARATITVDDRGLSWLRELIRVEVRGETDRMAGAAEMRGRA